jgi:hypothetical protein
MRRSRFSKLLRNLGYWRLAPSIYIQPHHISVVMERAAATGVASHDTSDAYLGALGAGARAKKGELNEH